MSKKQLAAVLLPPVLILTMIAVFRTLAGFFGETLGWYLGFFPYWLIWCGLAVLWLIGKESIFRLIRPQRPSWPVVFLLLVLFVGAALYKLIPGMNFGQENHWLFLMVISTAFGNGFFEELLWRGVYLELFPDNLGWGLVWPTIWFALWHYAPGTVSADNAVIPLIIGSGVFGFFLSYLSRKAKTIWWTILVHTIGGFIMVL